MLQVRTQTVNTKQLAILESKEHVFESAQDLLEFIVNHRFQGCEYFVINNSNLPATFFDLHTGLAGEALQKISNYRCFLAILGDYSEVTSTSLKFFIQESNRQGRVLFVDSQEEALKLWN